MLDLGTLQLGIKVDSSGATQELNQLGGQVEGTGSKVEGLGGKAKAMIKAFVAAYAVKELAKLGKAALDAYAQFEQLEGGVDKIFGKEAAKQVMQNANVAYKTAGVSANKYMEQVTSFSASLIQSMEGDTKAAAKVADMAIRDMSDNANVFGSDIQSIQDAYQGFAKQNYTMLDNLKLGYGGTRTEMERLLADAEKLTGQKYDISNLDDVYKAIHAVQQEMNITGTTAREASQTIEGSMNALKSSWENMLTAIGGGGNLTKALNSLFTSLGNVAKNIVPRVMIIIKNIIVAVIKGLPKFVNYISKGIEALADMIGEGGDSSMAKAGLNLIISLIKGMVKAIPNLIGSLVSLALSLASAIAENAQAFIEAGKEVITQFVDGFLEGHPKLQSAAHAIINGVLDPLQTAIKFVVKVIGTLKKGWQAIQKLKKSKKLTVDGIFDSAIQGMKDIFSKWKDILAQKAKKTYTVVKNGFKSVIDGMKSLWGKWKDILAQKSTKTFTTTYKTEGKPGKAPDGGGKGHRIGLRSVPYDGYSAILHRGETVLTAAESNQLANNIEASSKGCSNEPIYIENVIKLDGKVVARQTAPFMRNELGTLDRLNNRKLGFV